MKSIVLYLDEKGFSAREIYNDIVETLGPDAIGYSTVTKYLRTKNLSSNNIITENDQNISEEIENQILIKDALKKIPFASVREIAKVTRIPKSTVYLILTEQLHYVSKHLK